jgi:transketolase
MGEILVLKPGRDITLIACGIMVTEALRAAEVLAGDGVDAGVINVHTIKPLDEAGLVKAVQATGAVVTAEEHQIHGGLGSAVAEVVSRHCPCYIDMVAVQDVFGESGEPGELLSRYGLTHQNIREKALRVLKKTGTHP